MFHFAWNVSVDVPAGRATLRGPWWRRSRPRCRSTTTWCRRTGRDSVVVTCFFGRLTTAAWALVELYSCGPRATLSPALRGLHDLVVEPAELQLVPGAQVGGAGADADVVRRGLAALRHQRPVVDAVLVRGRGAGGVVEVRQAQVVGVLVGEHAHATVLRLDRVVGDPQAGVADLGAAVRVARRALAGVLEGLPAVRPDGVLALDRVAVGLVAARVHDLEVVDVAVGLVEVAVVVEVVAVPLVVGGRASP